MRECALPNLLKWFIKIADADKHDPSTQKLPELGKRLAVAIVPVMFRLGSQPYSG